MIMIIIIIIIIIIMIIILPSCGRNFLQKAHCFTLSPSITLVFLAFR